MFLGARDDPSSGIVELVDFGVGLEEGQAATRPTTDFFLVSLFVDVDAVLRRLESLAFDDHRRAITHES